MEAFLLDNKFSVVGLCEAWLSYGEADCLKIGDFCTKSLFLRQSSNYGGSLIMTTDGFNCSASTNVEQLSIDRHCELSGKYINDLDVYFINVYRPPSGDFNLFLDVLNKLFSTISSLKNNILLAGDFNVIFNKDNTLKTKLSDFMNMNS
ncbi:hypothetical protein Zmor_026779 [Zophobas morio]|uniref:Endonuclease/exonuclease/phosphatase domain-containing protein n=1 Tax=Zophobas morio TaxID=2755281 RepID=A0AA38M5G0_9CUCU|nr:hypothetical protein Zmor_026779 [Zophobas morio]